MGNFGIARPTGPVMAGGLADRVSKTAHRNPGLPQIARHYSNSPGTWTPVTAAELWDEVVDLAKGLVASGIRPGDRVAIMARTRYEWTVLGYALWSVGAEIVPIYPTSSHEQVAWILQDAHCVGVVVEDEQGVMTVGSACAALPLLRHVWQLDAGALASWSSGAGGYRRRRSTRCAGSCCPTPPRSSRTPPARRDAPGLRADPPQPGEPLRHAARRAGGRRRLRPESSRPSSPSCPSPTCTA